MRNLVVVLSLLGGPVIGQSPSAEAEFTAGKVTIGEHVYPYRLLQPRPADRRERRPLVVFLHGAGERGDDNERQLTWLPAILARPDWREREPCYLLAVQCPTAERWVEVPWDESASRPMAATPSRAMTAVIAALDEVLAQHRVDPARVYLTGLSMGGYGAWELAMRHPDRFAAALPVCGGGDERRAARLVGLPLTVYHGSADRVVPPVRSRAMVEAVRARGMHVEYRELAGVGHDSWRAAYGDGGALDWLFAQDQRQQARGAYATFAIVPTPDRVVVAAGRFTLLPEARCVARGEARAAAEQFAAAVARMTSRELSIVERGERPGDVVFRIAATGHDIECRIGEHLEVVAGDAAALRRAAAIAMQALSTWPDLSCPRGEFGTAAGPGGRIVMAAGAEPWSEVDLIRALRVAWLYGADAIHGGGDGWVEATARTAVRREAGRWGVTVASRSPVEAGAAVIFEPALPLQLADLLQRPCPAPIRYELRLPPGSPAEQLAALSAALPAAAERASRADRQIPVGGLLARVGALNRLASGN